MGEVYTLDTNDPDQIGRIMDRLQVPAVHFTNGFYALDRDMVAVTSEKMFQYLIDKKKIADEDTIMIGVNSDHSVRTHWGTKGIDETQAVRAAKISDRLSEKFNHQVMVIFFLRKTPEIMIDGLKRSTSAEFNSISKWGGYGAKPGTPRIEGAEHFKDAYAFIRHPDDDKVPIGYIDTPRQQNGDNVTVVNLFKEKAPNGLPYLGYDKNRGLILPNELL